MSSERNRDEVTVGDLEMVLRRASEIQAESAESEGVVRDRDVVQIAEELGIPRDAVDRALVELRSGELERARRPRGVGERLWTPREVVCVRTVPGSVEAVEARLREFLSSHNFAIQRNFGDELLWKRTRNAWEVLRSAFDSSAQNLQGCSQVSTSVLPGERGHTARVVIRMDLAELRGSAKTNALAGSLGASGLVLGMSGLAAVFASFLWLPIGALASIAISYGLLRGSVLSYRKHARQLEQSVEGFVDRLEHEPPALPG